jgi:hypothetical protein
MKISLFLIVIILLASCGAPMTKVMGDYENKKIEGNRLAIVLEQKYLSVFNSDDVIDDIDEGDAEAILDEYFTLGLQSLISRHTTFKDIDIHREYDNANFSSKELKISEKKSISINLPDEGDKIEISGNNEYVLIISSFKTDDTGASSMIGIGTGGTYHAGGSSATLDYYLKYVLWDNTNGKIISFGDIEQKHAYFIIMSESTWRSAMNELVKKVFKDTPFYKKTRFRVSTIPNFYKKEDYIKPKKNPFE